MTKSSLSTKITARVQFSRALDTRIRLTATAQYAATQVNTKINDTQKQIGVKRKAKENADDLMKVKADFEKEKKTLVELAAEKELILKKKINTIGNIVHDSVPISDNEVFRNDSVQGLL